MTRRAAGLCAILAAVVMIGGCTASGEDGMPMGQTVFTDFATLRPPQSPNTWLVTPAGYGAATPDETSPVFNVDAKRLIAAWRKTVEAAKRTRILATSSDGLQVEAQQKSRVFGFVDRISARAIPLGEGRSTLAAYSHSLVGYYDFGVNRRRIDGWLSDLTRRLP